MSFDVQCKNKDGLLVTYAHIGVCMPMLSVEENCMRLECGDAISCVFDTGSSYTLVDKSYLACIMAEPLPYVTDFHMMNGSTKSRQFKIDVCLPNHTLIQNLVVCSSDAGIGIIIGMDVISRGELTIYRKNSDGYIRFLTH